MGGYMCLGGICKTPWEDNYAHSQTDPASAPPAVIESAPPVEDQKAKELNELYLKQLAMARSGETTYLKAARAHQEDFFRLYPEERSNAYVNEYLSFMAVLGEKIDHKRMTETEAEYELAKKYRELTEESEQVARRQQQVRETKGVAQQAAMAEPQWVADEQRRKERGAMFYNLGLQILQWNHEQALAGQLSRQNCIWTRTHNGGYIQNCQ